MARDVYGEHYDDLTDSRKSRILELLALQQIEVEEHNAEMDKFRPG